MTRHCATSNGMSQMECRIQYFDNRYTPHTQHDELRVNEMRTAQMMNNDSPVFL